MSKSTAAPQASAEPDRRGGVWCCELELSGHEVLGSVVTRQDAHSLRVLVRLHGEPLGYLTLPCRPAPPSEDDLVDAAWREFGEQIRAHLHVEALPATSSTRPGPATPACPNHPPSAEPVSVVVCTRNRSETLAGCLDRLKSVSYPSVEFIVVDNAPTDDSTRRLVAAYAAVDDRFRYALQARPGLSRARNTGLAAARGTVVAYTDDDVSVDPAWVHGLVRGFHRRADVACVTGLVCTAAITNDAEAYFDARASSWSTRFTPRLFDLGTDRGNDVLYPFSAGIFGTGANFAFRRDRLLSLGGFDTALGTGARTRGGEDLDMFVRILDGGGAIAYEPSAVVWHHHRADEQALLRQLYGYGTGLTAYLTKLLLQRHTRYRVLARIPAGAMRMARIRRETERRLDRHTAAPGGAVRREFAGYLAGPVLYCQARWDERSVAAEPVSAPGAVVGVTR